MSERPAALYELKGLAERLAAEGEGLAEAPPVGSTLGLTGSVFRVKLGFNPNSSSLGTSVVTLVWGVGVAGALFQLVGQWIRADQQGLAGGLPPAAPGASGETSASASLPAMVSSLTEQPT